MLLFCWGAHVATTTGVAILERSILAPLPPARAANPIDRASDRQANDGAFLGNYEGQAKHGTR